ncbi:NAD(P)/FAD-dependent oxidoreductase [Microvirga rosea]|uniref:NAD(P)/FAD-dependent oxidoreductase n=1 Tax=Microvirga rosea TaxID=2715425 RepID=UPI001D0A2B6C|nr:FAD-binding oxidoreductase [Microvirga rosea]MCB8819166.1 FAD-binding oxidoreductase [Microvirga rosea]
MRIAIVGAGIIGVTAAHALLDAGHEVTLIDPEGMTGRATDANAGWIAHLDIMPLASPKVWRNLPRWMLDPLGPLAIRPGYVPRLAPWLLRFVRASSPRAIATSIEAIRAINGQALPAWTALLDKLALRSFLRREGILSVWRDASDFAHAKDILSRQRAYGIAVEILDPVDVRRIEPALQGVGAAVLYPEGCHVTDPASLAEEIFRCARERGARHIRQRVVAIERSPNAVEIRTDDGHSTVYDKIVIATGAWSTTLAKQAGDSVPLDTERGYNATFPSGTFGLARPVMFEGEGFVTTPLGIGDRVGGAVEFAGLQAPPNHRRTDAIVERLKRFLPHLDTAQPARRWMGFRPSVPDSLPVIGPATADGRIIYAFGHAHHGLTQAAITAQMVAALADGRQSPVDLKPFAAQRFRR